MVHAFIAAPLLAPASARGKLAEGGFRLAVDLAEAPLSGRWWRGLTTLLLLTGAVVTLGCQDMPLQEQAPASGPLATPELTKLTAAPLALGADGAAPAPMSSLVERLAEPPERPIISAMARVLRAGDLVDALRAGGVGSEEAEAAAVAATHAANLAGLQAGTALDLVLGRRETKAVPRPLLSAAFRAAFDLKLKLVRGQDGAIRAERVPIAVDYSPLRIAARVGGNLEHSAEAAGAPSSATRQLLQLLHYRVDMRRDVHAGDRFDMLLEHKRAATGEEVTGGLIYARLDREGGQPIELLRWQHPGSKDQYFMGDGTSAKRGMIAAPVQNARVSSTFGMRFHPILGYERLHAGTDFAAAFGSPIRSAASGRVIYAGWHGGHGNYVRVAHRPGLETGYGHMSRIDVHVGQAVAQGAQLGLVGSTGLSTGPHLHYEVWLNGQPVDPKAAHLPTGTQLAGSELQHFEVALAQARGRLRIADDGGRGRHHHHRREARA